jgi:hypothetical protein
MLNGARKNLSNLVLDFVTYLWDTTLASRVKIKNAVYVCAMIYVVLYNRWNLTKII